MVDFGVETKSAVGDGRKAPKSCAVAALEFRTTPTFGGAPVEAAGTDARWPAARYTPNCRRASTKCRTKL
ncbi:hypothetical protein D2962_04800 [Biomaibacter acetigenes]|uniref:Uncharacterized protein n=1 Tax=Biomaibacter acetigenes TaxID=2316383 RepID=A0A3G2R539_9FIRM|nr:hypothetical protein D2962_04800 [Biomaibacter acetigenes]